MRVKLVAASDEAVSDLTRESFGGGSASHSRTPNWNSWETLLSPYRNTLRHTSSD